ncbi:MAG: rRNA maturation RNase YbeY [Rhizobiales bacterium]|nr:rRNA maturation RNase YbeY [Hyphomicrobiales bacterium]
MDSDGPTTVALTVNAPAWEDGLGEEPEPPQPLQAVAARIVRATLEAAARTPWLKAGEVSVLLTDDREIRALNAAYRQRDRATNVLSFPGLDLADGASGVVRPPAAAMLGDIVMSHERLMAEADELAKAPLDHFAHLLVHGTLHLLGYDHEDDGRALVMEALEARILKTLGRAAPYTPASEVDAGPAAPSVAP